MIFARSAPRFTKRPAEIFALVEVVLRRMVIAPDRLRQAVASNGQLRLREAVASLGDLYRAFDTPERICCRTLH